MKERVTNSPSGRRPWTSACALLSAAALLALCSCGKPAGSSAREAAEEDNAEDIVAAIAVTSFPDNNITVSAVEGSARAMLQNAIDSCSLMGGGRVTVTPGTYSVDGSLTLKSDVDLHLDEGAVLLFSGRADDFLPVVFTRWEGTELYGRSPMLYALHAVNVAITGKGVIDAQGGKEFVPFVAVEAKERDKLRGMGASLVPVRERIFGKGTYLRPPCVQFVGCSRILVEGVTIKNSPFWTIHPLYCDNVIVRDVVIDSHYPNNDGCDPESSSNVLIEDCVFNTGDDAVAIKSGRDADGRAVGRPSRNIVIRRCVFNSECNGLCVGSEMSGGVENVFMDSIEIGSVKNAVYFKSNRDRGGYIRNVEVRNVSVRRSTGAVLRFETNYFGFRGGDFPAQYEDIRVRNVRAQSSDNYAVFIDGYEEMPVRDVVVENMDVGEAPFPYYVRCAQGVVFKDVTVNGEPLPESPEESIERKTLDVY